MDNRQRTYTRNQDGLTTTWLCDQTCTGHCDGHEAPGTGTRCTTCWYKPCTCEAQDDRRRYFIEWSYQ